MINLRVQEYLAVLLMLFISMPVEAEPKKIEDMVVVRCRKEIIMLRAANPITSKTYRDDHGKVLSGVDASAEVYVAESTISLAKDKLLSVHAALSTINEWKERPDPTRSGRGELVGSDIKSENHVILHGGKWYFVSVQGEYAFIQEAELIIGRGAVRVFTVDPTNTPAVARKSGIVNIFKALN